MTYYKVVEQITTKVKIDTKISNYGQTLINRTIHQPLLEIITKSSDAYDFPLDIYINLNNSIAFGGNEYLRHFPPARNGYYDLGALYLSPNKSLLIKQNDLVRFVEDIDKNGISFFEEGNYLWEYIYEEARKLQFPKRPARHESLFLFENKDDCQYYINTHRKFDGVICEVELLDTRVLFRGDMNIYDQIPNHFSYKEAFAEAVKYWNSEKSTSPVYEVLFQGICELRPI